MDIVVIDMNGGLYIEIVDSKKDDDRFILDLGKVMYGNYHPRAMILVNKFVGLYKDPISSKI